VYNPEAEAYSDAYSEPNPLKQAKPKSRAIRWTKCMKDDINPNPLPPCMFFGLGFNDNFTVTESHNSLWCFLLWHN
jgi:hypothetical protein